MDIYQRPEADFKELRLRGVADPPKTGPKET